jgi:hypothetical protein
MTNECLNLWLMEALRRAKPILDELGLPAYSAHYNHIAHALMEPLLGRWSKHAVIEEFITTYCDPNLDPISTRKLAIALYNDITALSDILDEEITMMKLEEFKTYLDNPKMKELYRLLYQHEDEEEEDWEEEDWEVEEWDIDEEDEVLAWWCEDQEYKTVIVCTKHSVDCHPEDDP